MSSKSHDVEDMSQCKFENGDSDVIIGEVELNEFVVSGPLPTEEWKCKAKEELLQLSQCSSVLTCSDHNKCKISCPSIAPHIRMKILGDGHCFFRALALGITGSQENHKAVHLALVVSYQIMLLPFQLDLS